jgi:hypothetical protein
MIIDLAVIHDTGNTIPAAGDLTYTVNRADYVAVTSVEARLRVFGSATIIDTYGLGKPHEDTAGLVRIGVSNWLSRQAPGNYVVAVAFTNPSGTTESAVTIPFTVPLVAL